MTDPRSKRGHSRCGFARVGDLLEATADGRKVARWLLHGLVLMFDHGTKLIDIALMMAVLRLTKGELDQDRDD